MDIHGNGIFDNKESGIVSKNYTVITENDIVGNQIGAVVIDGKASAKVCQIRSI